MKTDLAPDEGDSAFTELLWAARNCDDIKINDSLSRLRPQMRPLVLHCRPKPCDFSIFEQAAFWGALKASAKFDPSRSSDFSAFARMAIKCALQDEAGRMRRSGLLLLADVEDGADAFEKFTAGSGGVCPAVELESKEARREIRIGVQAWIAKRPVRQREYIRLHFTEGFSKAESARRMGISKAAVSKLHAAVVAAGRMELAGLEQHLIHLN